VQEEEMKVIAEDPVYTLRVYPEDKIVAHQMLGFVEGEAFRRMLITGLEAFREYGCTKWLSDDSRNPMMNPEDLEWSHQNWEPEIKKSGWKHWALIVPDGAFGKMAMRGLVQRYKEDIGVIVKFCESYDAGLEWLKTQS
jgi:hypothetical protein